MQSLASRRLSSNGPDWTDLAEMVNSFERQNGITLEVTLSQEETNGAPDLKLTAKAWLPKSDRRVVKPLASMSVTCRRERVRRLEGAITYLLYQLDFLLAEKEFAATDFDQA